MKPTLLLVLAAAACSEPGATDPAPVQIGGAVQKGPFVIGSNVQVAMLDAATGNATGVVFNTTTRSDLGEFELTIGQRGHAEIITSGYYFHELAGRLSTSALTLRALAELSTSGPHRVFVNAVTQMSYQRAKKLIAEGTPFPEAIDQAEGELEAALGLPVPAAVGRGTSMNLVGGDEGGNAYLLAASCLLLQAAQNAAPSSPEAKLQELVSQIALDLEDDGALEAGLTAVLLGARGNLNGDLCTRNLKARLAATGSTATVPDIRRALDFDGDGTVDADDPDADGDGVAGEAIRAALSTDLSGGGSLAVDDGGELWRWDLALGAAPARVALPPVKQIAGPYVLTDEGTVWTAVDEPARVAGLDGVSSISSPGFGSLLAVKPDGTVWRFSGTAVTQVTGTGVDDVAAAAGSASGAGIIILKKDGTVWATPCTDPVIYVVQVPGISTAVAVGGRDIYADATETHKGVAILADGSLVTWTLDGSCAGFAAAEAIAADVRLVSPQGDCVLETDGTVWTRKTTTLTRVASAPANATWVSNQCKVIVAGGLVYQSADGAYEVVTIPR